MSILKNFLELAKIAYIRHKLMYYTLNMHFFDARMFTIRSDGETTFLHYVRILRQSKYVRA